MKKLTFMTVSLLLSILFVFTSCEKDETDEPEVTTGIKISGLVLNVTGIGVEGATVQFAGPTKTHTETTDSNGNYSVSDLSEGTYIVSLIADGYTTSSNIEIAVSEDAIQNFEMKGPAIVTGKVLNSQTGEGVENAEITFYATSNKSTNDFEYVVFKLYSNAEGIYHLGELPEGFFNVRMSAPGFNDNEMLNIEITAGENEIGESTIVEEVAEGDIRIVLSWGEFPLDLDSHFTGPSSTGDRFHIYWVNDAIDDGTIAFLDVDDTQSYGPETITINQYLSGVYRYSVYNFSNDDSNGGQEIYNSPAKVEIYNSNGLIASFNPKAFTTGSGNTWRVFEFTIENDNINITTLDEYVYIEDEDDVNSFKSNNVKTNKTFKTSDF